MMSLGEASGNQEDPLVSALAHFREQWYAGTSPDPEAYCNNHPDCGPELREAIQDFLFVAERLPNIHKRGDLPTD